MSHLTFTSTVRLRSNNEKPGSWHFVTLPKQTADEIKSLLSSLPKRGRGSVRVEARIGYIKRTTSIFPEKKADSYLLPIKAGVRKPLGITAGQAVTVELKIL